MVTDYLEINGCKHFFVNQEKLSKLYFFSNEFLTEIDYETTHPLGIVYKPKNCIDTLIRFIMQRDNTVLIFKINDWKNAENPYVYPKLPVFKRILNYLQ
jgi:hypothetical protein